MCAWCRQWVLTNMSPESYNDSLPERLNQKVVSDAHARNSRQLLHAHVYNYLVKNGHYATARQFLREADMPLGEASDAECLAMGQQPAGLLPAQLKIDSDETLLLDWWNSFCRLRDHVENTPADEIYMRQTQEMPAPFLPNEGTSGQRGMREQHNQGSGSPSV
ncbi:MSS11 (YMR164C) [Zygosaccharomyces parabailii]|nr:MSS11 (YMR164C) [Zygosaccharomyces parabailii]